MLNKILSCIIWLELYKSKEAKKLAQSYQLLQLSLINEKN